MLFFIFKFPFYIAVFPIIYIIVVTKRAMVLKLYKQIIWNLSYNNIYTIASIEI